MTSEPSIRRRWRRVVEPPIIGLVPFGQEWVPNIHFTWSRDRDEFLSLAEWLCQEFGLEVVERYGGNEADAKEYWTLKAGESEWLLMRCFYPKGISLAGNKTKDLPAFESIARHVDASAFGWRYRWVRFKRWLGVVGR